MAKIYTRQSVSQLDVTMTMLQLELQEFIFKPGYAVIRTDENERSRYRKIIESKRDIAKLLAYLIM